MTEPKKTGWYSGDQKPVRPGWYETKSYFGPLYWDGAWHLGRAWTLVAPLPQWRGQTCCHQTVTKRCDGCLHK